MIKFSTNYNELNDWTYNLVKKNISSNIIKQEIIPFLGKKNGKEFFLRNKKEINNYMRNAKKTMNKYYEIFNQCLKKYFDYSLNDYPDIKVYLTFFTIYPRDLEKREFLIPATFNEELLVSIMFHEILHFAFFDKLCIRDNDLNEELRKASELLIPVFFSILSKELNIGNLYVSNYCVNDSQIKNGKEAFNTYLKNKDFNNLVQDFINIVR